MHRQELETVHDLHVARQERGPMQHRKVRTSTSAQPEWVQMQLHKFADFAAHRQRAWGLVV